jgi:hypothetical protein
MDIANSLMLACNFFNLFYRYSCFYLPSFLFGTKVVFAPLDFLEAPAELKACLLLITTSKGCPHDHKMTEIKKQQSIL